MNEKYIVEGDNEFRTNNPNFCIGPTSGCTLQFSADRATWTDADAIPAGVNWPVVNAPRNLWFRLNGNTRSVTIVY